MKLLSFAEEGKLGRSVVPHLMQELNWDCGLACIGMVLRALGAYTVTLSSLRDHVCCSTVWTIELCYILAHHAPDADFTYYTSYLGANPDHVQAATYYHDVTPTDLQRIDMMFALARRHTISIIRMTFPLDDYKRFLLHRRFAIIALVNAELLRCDICHSTQAQDTHSPDTSPVSSLTTLSPTFAWKPTISSPTKTIEYAGHFIVLIGYEPGYDSFIYRDPAVRVHFCSISASRFEIARGFSGTDDDCIVVKL